MKFRILLYCLYSLLSLHTFASLEKPGKRYFFKTLDISNGLSQNTVNCILQDKLGFMWFGTKDGLNRYDGLSFTVFKQEIGNKNSLGSNFVTAMYEDDRERLWVGTTDGLYIYHLTEERFEHFLLKTPEGEIIYKPINKIISDESGRFWIPTEGQGIFCYDEKEKTLTKFIVGAKENEACNIRHLNIGPNNTLWFNSGNTELFYSEDGKTFHSFTDDKNNNLFENLNIFDMLLVQNKLFALSNNLGLIELNTKTKTIKQLFGPKEGKHMLMRSIIKTESEELWIGSESGIYIYDLKTGNKSHLEHIENDNYSLSDNAIHRLYQDREGIIWIGSYFGGINYYPPPYTYFEKYYPVGKEGGFSGKRVREMCEDANGNIWIGTEDGGLNMFNPDTKEFKSIAKNSLYHNIHGLCIDNEYLWVGTFSKGLYKVHLKTHAIKDYSKQLDKYRLYSHTIYTIFKDQAGIIWVGTDNGVYTYDKGKDTFSSIPELNGNLIRDIKEDKEGNICIGTTINGLFYLDRKSGNLRNYTHDRNNSNSLPQNNVLSLFIDSKKQIWVTTQGAGFCLFDPQKETFHSYNSTNGLPNDVVYQLLEDDAGLFWISTNNGLSCFDPEQQTFSNYSVADGLPTKQFNYSSSLKKSDGTLYFGTIKGFIGFDPNLFYKSETVPQTVLTDFLLFNKKVPVAQEGSPLKKSITYSDKVVLSHKQNSFLIRFAALSYYASQNNQYLYQLEGFDKEWFSGNNSHAANYSNIRHGEYVFKLKASNQSGIWNEDPLTLTIIIRPPWWMSTPAYILYSLLFIFLIWYIHRVIKRRNALKDKIRQDRFEQEKEKEIYNAKIDFFTYVAHEIRTPLTLIKSPLENIIQHRKVEDDVKEDLDVIDRNTNRLLDLTNQLLDFRKIESQSLMLSYTYSNVSCLLSDLHARFHPMARQKKLSFNMDDIQENFFAPLDKEAFTKIVSNLLSNAVKNAKFYVHVSLQIDTVSQGEEFRIVVENDGEVIPTDQREHIFKPFVQHLQKVNDIKTGTGLGLALARSLAELHNGTLRMDKDETCNRFILTLPTTQENVLILNPMLNPDDEQKEANGNEPGEYDKHKASILIVEDDKELAGYIKKILSPTYNILTATDGKKALKKLDENYVNLIISDVMMPEMDGFAFCKQVKSDLSSSHIPVILLTAKADLQSKIEGIELGADAYIEKPFSNNYLIATISTLLRNREKLIESFKSQPLLSEPIQLSKADEAFITTMNEAIQKNMQNPDFNQDLFANALNMSKSSLYRKIRGIFDMSPNDFIRQERLKKAAQLFREGNDRVTEVCYLVGFNSPSYFTKCFVKQFGVHPKKFINTALS